MKAKSKQRWVKVQTDILEILFFDSLEIYFVNVKIDLFQVVAWERSYKSHYLPRSVFIWLNI